MKSSLAARFSGPGFRPRRRFDRGLPTVLFQVLIFGLLPAGARSAHFGDDVAFLSRHTDVLVLQDASGQRQVALVPAWQGRIMTSTAGGSAGASFGWINRELIASRRIQPHMNAFGGEDRFWMGPEGGQFSIFFAPGVPFEFEHWFTPAILDTLPFQVLEHSRDRAVFGATFDLTNYSRTPFRVQVRRSVQLIDADGSRRDLGVASPAGVKAVAFVSENRITNAGAAPWRKETGLLSVWILGMFNPSAATTIVVPIKAGTDVALGPRVTSDYFGEVPADRLAVREDVVYFRGDGRYRSKIGISPRRSKAVLGSFDAESGVLTIVRFDQPEGVTDYVNSLWQRQDNPFAGDAANSYNDGPPAPGAKPMGPFYELESSSPAAALRPGESLTHRHRTYHFQGSRAELDPLARHTLGVSLDTIAAAFPAR